MYCPFYYFLIVGGPPKGCRFVEVALGTRGPSLGMELQVVGEVWAFTSVPIRDILDQKMSFFKSSGTHASL